MPSRVVLASKRWLASIARRWSSRLASNAILAKMAFDAKRDDHLRAIDASHLFDASTTRLGIKRGAYLRRYAYEFIEMFAPQLSRSIVERTVAGEEGSRYEL